MKALPMERSGRASFHDTCSRAGMQYCRSRSKKPVGRAAAFLYRKVAYRSGYAGIHGLRSDVHRSKAQVCLHVAPRQQRMDYRHRSAPLRRLSPCGEKTRLPVWLAFYHRESIPSESDRAHGCPSECPTGLYVGELFEPLTTENHRSKNFDPTREGFVGHGKSGMVYWAESTLKKIASKKSRIRYFPRKLPQMNSPTQTFFPRLVGAEFDALVNDIAANGLRDPIVLHNGMILDGGNRAAACERRRRCALCRVRRRQPRARSCCRPTCIAGCFLPARRRRLWRVRRIGRGLKLPAEIATQIKVPRGALILLADRSCTIRSQRTHNEEGPKVAKADPDLAKAVGHGHVSLPAAVAKVEGKEKPSPKPKPAAHRSRAASCWPRTPSSGANRRDRA